MTKERYKRFWKNADGAVAATYAIALIPLIAVAGLAFDYTRAVGLDTELQNAADQAALAGATQLDRTAGSMERAIAAIQGGLIENTTLFSNDGSGSTVAITDATQIIFYSSKADAETGTNGFTDVDEFANAGFVQVTVDTRDANYTLTPIVGALNGSLNASAVAGLGSAICRIPPIMVCNPDEGNLSGSGEPGAKFDIAKRAGTGVKAVAGPTGSGPSYWRPGNFGFLDLGNGADAVAQGLGWLGPDGLCVSVDGNETISPDTEPGLKAGAIDSINTRFDIYQNESTCKYPGLCPSAFNARKDLIRRADKPADDKNNACKINDDAGWHETTGTQYLPSTDAPLPTTVTPTSMGHPRDMCHAISADGNCTDDRFGDGRWDRDAYFRSHYVRPDGSSWNQADWQANIQLGANGLSTTTPTRYEVYLWEQSREGDLVDGVRILAPSPASASGATEVNHAKPICSQEHGYSGTVTVPDRRVMTVAVVNCTAEEVSGKTSDVAIASWIDVFLVQPSATRARTDKSDIYFEVIRETDLSRSGAPIGPTIRRDVPYLVR